MPKKPRATPNVHQVHAPGRWLRSAIAAAEQQAMILRPLHDGQRLAGMLACDPEHPDVLQGFWLLPTVSGRMSGFATEQTALPVARWSEGWPALLDYLGDRALVADDWARTLPEAISSLRQLDAGRRDGERLTDRLLARPQADLQEAAAGLANAGVIPSGSWGLGELAARVPALHWERYDRDWRAGQLDQRMRLRVGALVWESLLRPRLAQLTIKEEALVAAPAISAPVSGAWQALVEQTTRPAGLALWFPAQDHLPIRELPFDDLLIDDHPGSGRRVRLRLALRGEGALEVRMDARSARHLADALRVPIEVGAVVRPSESAAVRIEADLHFGKGHDDLSSRSVYLSVEAEHDEPGLAPGPVLRLATNPPTSGESEGLEIVLPIRPGAPLALRERLNAVVAEIDRARGVDAV